MWRHSRSLDGLLKVREGVNCNVCKSDDCQVPLPDGDPFSPENLERHHQLHADFRATNKVFAEQTSAFWERLRNIMNRNKRANHR